MSYAFGETSEALGGVLLPFIEAAAPLLAKLAQFISKNSSVIVPLVAAILGAAAAIKVITIAQLAWNVAVAANPLGLIVIAIAAVGVAIFLLVKHWDTVTAATKKAWQAIKGGAQDVIDWFKSHWPYLLGILTGPFGLAVVVIIKHWDKISDAAGDLLARIKAVFGAIAGYIEGQIGRIARAVQRVVDAIKAPINAVLSQWNAISFSVPRVDLPSVTVLGKKVGGGSFGGWDIGTPDIPLLAKGGVVATPTLVMAGEGHGREIIAPEALLRSMLDERPVNVRVFIGDQELRGLVRTEIVRSDTGLARTLLAGARV
jgi:hypothetical protein